MMWYLNLVNAFAVSKYPNILNILMLKGDEVAYGNALDTMLVRVHWNVKEQSFYKGKS